MAEQRDSLGSICQCLRLWRCPPPQASPDWGWNFLNQGEVAQTESVSQNCIFTYNDVAYVEADGTTHPFSISYTTKVSPCGSGTTGTTTGYATDDSGYYINVNPASGVAMVYSPDGTQISAGTPYVFQIEDTNGNYVTVVKRIIVSYIDSAGREALMATVGSFGTEPTKYL